MRAHQRFVSDATVKPPFGLEKRFFDVWLSEESIGALSRLKSEFTND
jgi:hypothetical protein